MFNAKIEAALGRAHRNLWTAAQEADITSQHSVYDDLVQLLGEIERIQFSLLRAGGQLRTSRASRA